MERAVNVPGGCRRAIRTGPLKAGHRSLMPLLAALLSQMVGVARAALPDDVQGSSRAPSSSAPAVAARRALLKNGPKKPQNPAPAAPSPASHPTQPAAPSPLISAGLGAAADPRAGKRYMVRDKFNECVVARFHGQFGDKTALLLPDGQLGTVSQLVPTDEPFQPLSKDQLRTLLHQGPFLDYQVLQTDHYLIFYKSTEPFARDSGRLLEDLYRGFIDAFRRKEFPVHESEFPLVAVIFATESEFRAHKQVDQQVRAYYEYFTNRIFFFQKSEKEDIEPKVSALLSPQTVAHEGAHQVLSNIGVQPRPNSWPLWLVEGLAEYCATTVNTRKGIVWSGMGAINSLHMATIRELEDPLSNQINAPGNRGGNVARPRSIVHAESLMLKTALTPTDYARAWALTNYLALKRGPDFIKYLKAMSQVPPFEKRTPQANLAEFRKYFSDDLAKLDKKVDDYIHKQSLKKFDPLYCYAVVFQQSLGNGVAKRGAYVSQSPQMIEQWVLEMTEPNGAPPSWEANPWPTRARAILAAEEWMRRGF